MEISLGVAVEVGSGVASAVGESVVWAAGGCEDAGAELADVQPANAIIVHVAARKM